MDFFPGRGPCPEEFACFSHRGLLRKVGVQAVLAGKQPHPGTLCTLPRLPPGQFWMGARAPPPQPQNPSGALQKDRCPGCTLVPLPTGTPMVREPCGSCLPTQSMNSAGKGLLCTPRAGTGHHATPPESTCFCHDLEPHIPGPAVLFTQSTVHRLFAKSQAVGVSAMWAQLHFCSMRQHRKRVISMAVLPKSSFTELGRELQGGPTQQGAGP